MNYKIETETFVFEGKEKGDFITEKELQDAGLHIEALVVSGHLSSNKPAKTAEPEGATD